MAPFQSDSSFPDDDHALVAQVADGDAMALATLYDRHALLIHSLSLRILEDAGEASEVTCEVFLSIAGNARQYQSSEQYQRSEVPVWLSALARHRAVGRLRRPGWFRPRLEASGRAAGDARKAMSIPLSPDESPRQEDPLQEALAGMPAEQRQVLELAWFDGLTPQEIADRLGLTPESVRAGLRLPRLHLRSPVEEPVGCKPKMHA